MTKETTDTPPQPAAVGAQVQRGVRRVVCAAVLYEDGTLLVGPRHYDSTMLAQYKRYGIGMTEDQAVQGFVDQWGAFMTREEAHKMASEQGQIRHRCGGDNGRLFSENLY